MFKFLKDKIKGAISTFTKKVEESPAESSGEKSPEVLVVSEGLLKVTSIPVDADRVVETSAEKTPVPKSKKGVLKPEVKIESPISKSESKSKNSLKTNGPKSAEKIPTKIPTQSKTAVPIEQKTPSLEKSPVKMEMPSKKLELAGEKPAPIVESAPVEKKGFFSRLTEKITTKKIDSAVFDELFWELELGLLENNVAVEVIEKIKADLKGQLVDKPLARTKVEQIIVDTLQKSVRELFAVAPLDLIAESNKKKPLVICLVGINGSGKTTTIAKLAKFFINNGKSVVLAAGDTFRAAAIDQLQIHADALGVKLIRHEYGSDAAAVAFDAITHAKSKNKDVVLIDTAGRLHSNQNLVEEMKKIIRVAKPDFNIFVGESITGNDCVEQAVKFNEAIGLQGIILSKADIDEKGGAAISVSFVTKKPILYLGVGQGYDDLVQFNPDELVAKIFS